jgi:hypothetical protein
MKKWQCTKCGKVVSHPTNPGTNHGGAGKCPETASKNHIWNEVK